MLENRLVCILACGLQIRMVTKSDYDDLCGCSSDDWQKLFEIALKHNVGGVFYDGLQSIYSCFGDPLKDCGECKKLKATLLHTTLRLEQLNRKQTLTLRRMGTYLGDNGCTMMVMKGQACGLFYPNPLHRSVGDIDFYLFEDYERGNELVRNLGIHVDDSWYKHSEFSIDGKFEESAEEIKTYARSHGLKIVSPGFYQKWADVNVNVDPVNLLSWFKGAECVVTNTFHGCVMSIISGTEMAVRLRGNANKLLNLMTEYEIVDREFGNGNSLESVLDKKIDWTVVNEQVKYRRAQSMDYLKRMIAK
ncbi:MAG: nucleotidyltransferase family protein [Bacteroidaceae bacterium]|nr:nucleotidyltransferase family protein [Bacteroidaceae bacterium]